MTHTERFSTPESPRGGFDNPELVRYGSNDYVLEVTALGAQVDFNGSDLNDAVKGAFDLTGRGARGDDTMVALECSDSEGKRVILVGGTAYNDLVCQLDIEKGKETTFRVWRNPAFNEAVAEAPMTIGAQHNRLGNMTLTKVSASPQTGISDGREDHIAPKGKISAISFASKKFAEYTAAHNRQ